MVVVLWCATLALTNFFLFSDFDETWSAQELRLPVITILMISKSIQKKPLFCVYFVLEDIYFLENNVGHFNFRGYWQLFNYFRQGKKETIRPVKYGFYANVVGLRYSL